MLHPFSLPYEVTIMKLHLFKKDKKKKPLSDKAKDERKQKCKKIIKRVLDILVYGFAIFMIFGLILGSCSSNKAKVGSAYYHSENGYTSINSVVTTDSTSTLRYYYDYNYQKTFPDWACFFDIWHSNVTQYFYVDLVTPYTIDNKTYSQIRLSHSYSNSTHGYYLAIVGEDIVNFVSLHQSAITIDRSDILVALFSGNYVIAPSSTYEGDLNFYRFLVYYFGPLGYNRIDYTFPLNIQDFSFLFAYSDNEDSVIENGLFFKNDTFPTITPGDYGMAQSHTESMFSGSFRSGGVYYHSVEFQFTSVYGRIRNKAGNYVHRSIYLPGASFAISCDNQFYVGYWYLDAIYFSGNGVSTQVWSFGTREQPSGQETIEHINPSWFGDSAYSTSLYRSAYIYYANDSLSGLIHNPFNDTFVQLNQFTFADFINYIGDAYPTQSSGVPQDNTTPFVSVFNWLKLALTGVLPFFSYSLIPGITIGTLFMIPVTMTIILFVVKLFKR